MRAAKAPPGGGTIPLISSLHSQPQPLPTHCGSSERLLAGRLIGLGRPSWAGVGRKRHVRFGDGPPQKRTIPYRPKPDGELTPSGTLKGTLLGAPVCTAWPLQPGLQCAIETMSEKADLVW